MAAGTRLPVPRHNIVLQNMLTQYILLLQFSRFIAFRRCRYHLMIAALPQVPI